tara:strand:- start:23614 stop:24762 length:1149 start_codon:yes stop_codon:yes gene_type:complete
MKVLHLASFSGNIGDNANHSGFRPWFERISGCLVDWTDLEIREFYWKEKKFDESFVKLVSSFDLLVIGGGNYFELWVEHSATGTSIDIPLDIFSQINVPIFFNALGCDEGQGVSENTLEKFTSFLDILVGSPQYLVSVRNDGSKKTLRKHVGIALSDKVYSVPDAGFFVDFEEIGARYLRPSTKRVGINLATDMADIRFGKFGGKDGCDNFCDEFAKMLDLIADEDLNIHYIFFPHIYGDLEIIANVISRLGDRLRRTRVTVAPYLSGNEGSKHIFGLYRQCQLVLGMRFHSSVCAMGMGVPVIGLCNFPQIEYLYEELNYTSGCVSVRGHGFSEELIRKILETISYDNQSSECDRITTDVLKSRDFFEPVLSTWLIHNSLV